MSYLDYVNPLQGTDSVFNFSNGNTLPLVSMPFGMNAWTLQTKDGSSTWFFHPHDRHCHGVRLTHQPSPWIGDYGSLLFMPQTGKELFPAANWGSSCRIDESVISPDYLKVFLIKDRINFELTTTERGAVIRLEYQDTRDPRLIISQFEGSSCFKINEESGRVTGYTGNNKGGVPDNFAMYFVMDFDCSFQMDRTKIFNKAREQFSETSMTGDALGLILGLDLKENKKVTIRMATSFISIEQAVRNLEREIGSRNFDEVRSQARRVWEEALGRVEVSTRDEDKKRIFYSCLYRNLLFPRMFYEYDSQGSKYHYSPYDGKVYPGVMYTDNGLWDTYRTTYPLYSLLYPSRLSEILEGWVNVYRESGWMPRWVSPGVRDCMPGTLIDAVFADAAVKGIKGFDLELAYEGLLKHAKEAPDAIAVGRYGLQDYLELGYLPADTYKESVSNSLDFIYGDFCIAQVAGLLGKQEDYEELMERALNYRKLFDPAVGFMRGRNKNGEFTADFDPIEWGGPYCEGGAWQCSWAVQHDLRGLAQLMGGREKLHDKLEALMTEEPYFRVGTYPYEIHEMSEMAAADFGQCALSNQPSFHIPYIYAAIGYPHRTQYWVREALNRLFTPGTDGFPGDEDNGSMGAWYIFSAMGFYPLCPGVNQYVLGSPLFDRVQLNYEDGRKLTITAEHQEEDSPYVHEVYLNGKEHRFLYFTQEELTDNTVILFRMGRVPKEDQGFDKGHLPFSMSSF